MDGNTKAIAEALRRWYEAPSAVVIDFAAAKKRIQSAQQADPRCRPAVPPPEAA